MVIKRVRAPWRVTRGALLLAIGAACVTAVPSSNTRAAPGAIGIKAHVISSGGKNLHNSCYQLAGTVGQTSPGYSSSAGWSVYAGFWASAPTHVDDIFLNGFEAC
jgi:hypothetical protein